MRTSGNRVRALVVATIAVSGCGSHRPPELPSGTVLEFDAAMLHPSDAGIVVGHDAAGADGHVVGTDAHVTGSDAGHSCTGVAESCTTVGASGCLSQRGCSPGGQCTGLATLCFDLFDSFSCGSQDGCYWSSSTMYCSGSAWSCDLESGSATCTSQQGCHWTTTCTGVPTS